MGYAVAVIGATGAVGAQMIKMLEESTLPIDKIATAYVCTFCRKKFCNLKVWYVKAWLKILWRVDIARFSQLVVQHRKYAPYAVKAGAVIGRLTLYFVKIGCPIGRSWSECATMLITGIISYPNCSTIQIWWSLLSQFVKNGAWTVSSCLPTKLYRGLVWGYSETQRELKEVWIDGVNPRCPTPEILPCGGE